MRKIPPSNLRRQVRARALLVLLCTLGAPACTPTDDGGAADAHLVPKDADVDGAFALADQGGAGGAPQSDATAAPGGSDAAAAGTDARPGSDALAPSGDAGPAHACGNGQDDDGDGLVDFPADRGCMSADDDDEVDPPPMGAQCGNGLDDDGDGAIDLWDADCTSAADPTERGDNPTAACGNGQDDDADGRADFPGDPGCRALGDDDETDPANPPACANGADDDADGRTDFPDDPGCQGRGDADEADPAVPPACANGLDDDGNGTHDYPADPGCDSAADPTETGPCGEGHALVDLNAAVAAEGGFDGDLTGAPAGLVGTCGGAAGGELVFAWRSTGLVDRVTFSTRHALTHVPTVVYVRRVCGGPGDLACARGGAEPGAEVTLMNPEEGLYYVVVDQGAPDLAGTFHLSVREERAPACRNAEDDDADGRVDAADPGCAEADDGDELDPDVPPVCANGLDDDGDGATDYPADPDCTTAGADREAPLCPFDAPQIAVGQAGGVFELPLAPGNGNATPSCDVAFGGETVLVLTLDELSRIRVDVARDGAPAQGAIYARTACGDAASEIACVAGARGAPLVLGSAEAGVYFIIVEQGFPAPMTPATATVTVESLVRECNDGVDNDDDGALDLTDPGCENDRDDSEADPAERPACSNGVDDDADGLLDFPADDGCEAAGDTDELSRDRHLSEDFQPDGVGQIWCNAEGAINFHDYGPMTFPDCDALANRTGTQYYAGVAWQGLPGDGWLGAHDEATATASNPGFEWDRTVRLPIDMPHPCRLALMPHRSEPDVGNIGPEGLFTDAAGHRWHFWRLSGQTHSQCLAYADTVRGRIINPWSVGLGREVTFTSPTHWCHAGPFFNQDGRGLNSDERGDCVVGFWE